MISFEDMFRKRFGRPPTKDEMAVLIDQSVTSFNQSGGITAHTVNVGPQPRSMDPDLEREILQKISKSRPITVVALMGDAEAFQFAKKIHAFLSENGFKLSENGISQAVYNEPIKGLNFDPQTHTFAVGANL